MKRLLTIVLLAAASVHSSAQAPHPLPMVDNKITFSEVVQVEGVGKDELYSRAKLWLAETFRSSNDVLQLDDRQAGMLLGKGVIRQETGGRNAFASEPDVVKTWRFTIKLQLRDGRYKVDIYDFDYSFEQPAYSHMPGLKPTTRNLDTFYSDRKTYKKDGTLQRGAPTNIANWTNETFIAMLANIKSAMAREVAADDF